MPIRQGGILYILPVQANEKRLIVTRFSPAA